MTEDERVWFRLKWLISVIDAPKKSPTRKRLSRQKLLNEVCKLVGETDEAKALTEARRRVRKPPPPPAPKGQARESKWASRTDHVRSVTTNNVGRGKRAR
jgi:hypothetical protein